jgi:tetratricopeptide (TPR) repeat protein
MAEVTLEAAPPKARDMFHKGFAAMERGNLDYAIDMFTACLEIEPRLHRARRFLRLAEVKQTGAKGSGGLTALAGQLTSMPTVLATHALLKSGKPLPALSRLEKALRKDPLNPALTKVLGEIADALDEPEIAIQTLAILREQKPDDPEVLDRLGRLYMNTDQHRQARECFEHLVELRPTDGAALKALKDSLALDSMAKDGWIEAASSGKGYRHMIKDQKEALILEQESKAVKSQKDAESLIAENLARIQQEPKNINYRRALATLYAGMQRFPEAIKALQDALALSNDRDPQLDNALSQVRIQQFEWQIKQLREGANNAAADRMAQDLEVFRFDDLQERVTRYPNDLQLKHDLGVLLLSRGRINEAIQQFQTAQRSAQFRVSSLYHIGLCFKEKKQYDLAAEQFTRAVADLGPMDDQKKSIVYELAQVMEQLGKPAEALAHYKQIYQADITYRDVADKVERVYRPNAG